MVYSGVTIASCAIGCLLLVMARPRIAGTTLLVPWAWSLFACLALAAAEIAILALDNEGTHLATVLRYAAAVTTLAPGMAMLGAKRPQEFMFFLATVTLIAMAWTPVALSIFVRPGQPLAIPCYLPWLLCGELLYVALNYLPTRFGLAALVTAIGQSLLIATAWPVYPMEGGPIFAMVGSACLTTGLALACWDPWQVERTAHAADRRWLEFRDAYGLVWGMRVAERVNQSAERFAWDLRLEWDGFHRAAEDESEQEREGQAVSDQAWEEADLGLRALLKRFVGKDW